MKRNLQLEDQQEKLAALKLKLIKRGVDASALFREVGLDGNGRALRSRSSCNDELSCVGISTAVHTRPISGLIVEERQECKQQLEVEQLSDEEENDVENSQ